jgi:hypothetical protein
MCMTVTQYFACSLNCTHSKSFVDECTSARGWGRCNPLRGNRDEHNDHCCSQRCCDDEVNPKWQQLYQLQNYQQYGSRYEGAAEQERIHRVLELETVYDSLRNTYNEAYAGHGRCRDMREDLYGSSIA